MVRNKVSHGCVPDAVEDCETRSVEATIVLAIGFEREARAGVADRGRVMTSLKGQLLIASPGLLASFFTRTVILMLDHSEEGAAGVVLNRPTEATIADVAETVFAESIDWDKPLNLGGPVAGPLMVLHQVEDLSDQEILPGLYNTVEISNVRALVEARTEPSIILANYAGWGPGQLESEFDVDSWLTLPATIDHVFWESAKDLWDVVVKAINARKLSEFLGLKGVPSDPSLN
jgi:putative transcriptional regulator